LYARLVDDQIGQRLGRVVDGQLAAAAAGRASDGDGAGVADLTARAAIHRRAVADHLDLLAGFGAGYALARGEQRQHPADAGIAVGAAVAEERRRPVRGADGVVAGGDRLIAAAGELAALALLLHLFLEASVVDGEVLLAADDLSQIEREAVGVV